MQVLRVRHVTRYRYARPVSFGEHRIMLRPRDDDDQKVILHRLVITPEPLELSFVRDGLGNWAGLARFAGASNELCFENEIHVQRPLARLTQDADLEPAPAGAPPFLRQLDADRAVAGWAKGFLTYDGVRPTLATLTAMNRAIRTGFRYRRRLEHGVQSPAQTLALRSGACRDYAMLLIAAARALGLQARFASGYVHCPGGTRSRRRGGGHTHAWASILTPGHGWIDFDPTSGAAGPHGLVRVALAEDPVNAIPIQGVYFGKADEFLGMDVEVTVDSHADSALAAAQSEPDSLQSVAWSAA
jgi:transglutaminase-like putative cysteine protease